MWQAVKICCSEQGRCAVCLHEGSLGCHHADTKYEHKWMMPDCADQEHMEDGWEEELRKYLARKCDREPLELALKLTSKD